MAELDDIRDALRALRSAGVVPAAAPALAARQADLDDWLQKRILADVEAYTVTTNPDVAPRLQQHLAALAGTLQSWFAGEEVADPADTPDYARWCADRKFPLEAILLGYAAIQQDLLTWLRDAALESADASAQVPRVVADITRIVIRFTGRQTSIASAEYVAHTRAIAEAEGDRRTRLLDLLLHGYDESDQRAATLLRRSGYLEQRQSYCVIIAQPVDAAEMHNPARAERLRAALTKAVDKLGVRSLVAIRDTEVVAVISRTRRLSGWTPQQSSLADDARTPLRRFGNAIILGVSNDAPSTSHIPGAYREAALALELASVTNRVSLYKDIGLRDMLLHAGRDRIGASLPAWAGQFLDADTKGKLAATVRGYADASMNVQQAAKALAVHPNTLYARFRKIHDLTGKDPLVFHDLNELLLTAELRR